MIRWFALAGALLVAACSAETPSAEAPRRGEERQASTPPGPSEFVVLPCQDVAPGTPCALVMAGGKSLVFGAPEGITGALARAGVGQPDAVFLITLEGAGLEGLMRLRNTTWIGGRTSPLPVAGPEGSALALAYLDKALEQADSLTYVQHQPPGRFDSALFATVDVKDGAPVTVFDTGDLNVIATGGKFGNAHYAVRYGGRLLALLGCPSPSENPFDGADPVIACETGNRMENPWGVPAEGLWISRLGVTAGGP
ncbi:MAG: hypothetical protein AAGJ32_04710 [Pseudomonadota bacterium]